MACDKSMFEWVLGRVLDHAKACQYKLASAGYGAKCAGLVAEKYASMAEKDIVTLPWSLMIYTQKKEIIEAASADAIAEWDKMMALPVKVAPLPVPLPGCGP